MGAFKGVAETYETSRHGYPPELGAHLVASEVMSESSLVVDLGAGTGQLVRLVAPVVAEAVAVEPEADMLAVGQQATAGLPNVRWIQGRDADIERHFAPGEIDLVVIGNAFHHMDQRQLLHDLGRLVAPDGAVCIAASSVPVWLQDSDWSHVLRSALEAELGPLSGSGVPDMKATTAVLLESAFSDARTWSSEQANIRTCESVLGEVISSSSEQFGPEALARFGAAIEPFADHEGLPEVVQTTAVIATRPKSS